MSCNSDIGVAPSGNTTLGVLLHVDLYPNGIADHLHQYPINKFSAASGLGPLSQSRQHQLPNQCLWDK